MKIIHLLLLAIAALAIGFSQLDTFGSASPNSEFRTPHSSTLMPATDVDTYGPGFWGVTDAAEALFTGLALENWSCQSDATLSERKDGHGNFRRAAVSGKAEILTFDGALEVDGQVQVGADEILVGAEMAGLAGLFQNNIGATDAPGESSTIIILPGLNRAAASEGWHDFSGSAKWYPHIAAAGSGA